MNLGLEGRIAAIAASSDGLGLATARALAREGARVSLSGRDPDRLRAAALALEKETGRAPLTYVADVGRAADCARFVDETASAAGGLDILVTNGGGPPAGTFDDLSAADWAAAYASTLANVLHLVRAAVPHMRRRKWGRIVNVASISAKQPLDRLVLSNTFRAAIVGLSKSLSNELAKDGILVNTVCPGFTRTGRLEELIKGRAQASGTSPAEAERALVGAVPLGRIADPQEFGDVVAFLCSERASYVTGVTLPVDGGAIRGA
jgi:3-oxoacyl-[acyl-carrier protein] reductase